MATFVAHLTAGREPSVLGFDLPWESHDPKRRGRDSDTWSRYLTINGERAYFIGGRCDTCDFLFSREPSLVAAHPPLVPALSEQSDPTVLADSFGSLLPKGDYLFGDVHVRPRLITGPSAGDYFTNEAPASFRTDTVLPIPPRRSPYPYYRADAPSLPPQPLGDGRDLPRWMFQFLCGFEDPATLDREQVNRYRAQRLAGDALPVAVSLSVLDVRAPAIQETDVYGSHYCLSHYVLDGHHKIQAAAELGESVRLRFFLSRAASIASEDDFATISAALSPPPGTLL